MEKQMIVPVMNATLEFRFKKSQPSLEEKLNGTGRPQIFLQQKFIVQSYDKTKMQDMVVPAHMEPEDAIPPQLMAHVEIVGPTERGLRIKVPSMTRVHIQWFNVPAVDDGAPDIEEVPIPQPEQEG